MCSSDLTRVVDAYEAPLHRVSCHTLATQIGHTGWTQAGIQSELGSGPYRSRRTRAFFACVRDSLDDHPDATVDSTTPWSARHAPPPDVQAPSRYSATRSSSGNHTSNFSTNLLHTLLAASTGSGVDPARSVMRWAATSTGEILATDSASPARVADSSAAPSRATTVARLRLLSTTPRRSTYIS